VKADCAGNVTPFDGDHQAGIQVLNTSNFPDGQDRCSTFNSRRATVHHNPPARWKRSKSHLAHSEQEIGSGTS
jgi:hypothetical protein